MPTNASQVHVDAALTNVSVAYARQGFIAASLAPEVNVMKQSDKYYKLDVENERARQEDVARAPGARANETNFITTTDSYFADDHALEHVVPDEIRQNADPAIQADIDGTEFVTDKITLDREIDLFAKLDAGITNAAAVSNGVWSLDTSTPIADVRNARATIIRNILAVPNVLGISFEAFEALANHPEILDRVKYGGAPGSAAVITEQALAQVFQVDRVLVGKAYKNTAAKGATASNSAVMGTTAYLGWVPERVGLRQPTLAATFAWNPGGGVQAWLVEKWREDPRKSDVLRVSYYYDQKVILAAAGFRITGVTS